MIDERTRMLIDTIRKLHRRDARANIQRVLVKTRTADIAAMLEAFSTADQVEIFQLEPSWDKRSEILSYLPKDQQMELVTQLDREVVGKLVQLMDSDDAADLLGRLPEEVAADLLSSMEKEDQEEVVDLMSYPDDSAGGLMSSDVLSMDQNLTVEQAIRVIQDEQEETAIPFYIYAVNDNQQLVGVVSLKQLLLSKKTETLKHLMIVDVVSVSVDTQQEEVAKMVERYDFLAMPVVDNSNRLVGVITVDDVIDVIREEAEEDLLAMGQAGWELDASTFEHFRARAPWLILAFAGGALCFSIVYFFGYLENRHAQVGVLWLVSAFIPLLLAVGSTVGGQAATVSVSVLRSRRMDMRSLWEHLRVELRLGLMFSVIFGVIVYILGGWLFSGYGLSATLALTLSIQIFLAHTLGSLVPWSMQKVGIDPTMASVPLFTVLADVMAVAVLFSLLHA
jgi:magnesium transporter